MRLRLISIVLLAAALHSCSTYYSAKDYKKFTSQASQPPTLLTEGYYYFEDSTYHYYNYKNDGTGAYYPNDSLPILYYHFIVLFDNGRAHVDISTTWDGLNHSAYDSEAPAYGNNTKEAAHQQFLENAKNIRVFDNSIKRKYPGQYRMYGDSIAIQFFQQKMSDYQLTELTGHKIDPSTFVLTRKKEYRFRSYLDKPKTEAIEKLFHFEEYTPQ